MSFCIVNKIVSISTTLKAYSPACWKSSYAHVCARGASWVTSLKHSVCWEGINESWGLTRSVCTYTHTPSAAVSALGAFHILSTITDAWTALSGLRGSARESRWTTGLPFYRFSLCCRLAAQRPPHYDRDRGKKERRSVKLLKFNYLIFWMGLSSCCVYSRVVTVSEGQNSGRL